MWLWDVIMVCVLGALVFVVIGPFLAVPSKVLRGVLLAALAVVLVRTFWELPPNVIMLSLLMAIGLSARLMFGRRSH